MISIEASPWAYFIAGVFGFLATLATIGTFLQLYWALQDRQVEIVGRQEERAERAWSHLMTRLPGQSGKGAALDILFSLSEPTEDIDLTCKNIGKWDDVGQKCDQPAVFDGVEFSKRAGERFKYDIEQWISGSPKQNFPVMTDQMIVGSDFTDTTPTLDWFYNVVIERSNLYGATIYGLIGPRGAIRDSDLTAANIAYEQFLAQPPTLDSNNVSDAVFHMARPFDVKDIQNIKMVREAGSNWFWADRPPREIWTSDDDRNYVSVDTATFHRTLDGAFEICDPRFRASEVNYKSRKIDEGSAAGEIDPTLVNNLVIKGDKYYRKGGLTFGGKYAGASACPTLSVEEAIKLYPHAYATNLGAEMTAYVAAHQ